MEAALYNVRLFTLPAINYTGSNQPLLVELSP